MTFLELRTEVLANLIDTPAYIQAAAPTLVNRAIKDLQRKRNFYVMRTTVTFNTAFEQRTLADVPSNFKMFNGKPYYVEELGMTYPIAVASSKTAAEMAFGTDPTLDFGRPQVIAQGEPSDSGERKFEVYPFPDGNSDYADGEYRIRIPYFRFLPVLTTDAATNWFTDNAEEWIVFRATARGFARLWGEDHARDWNGRAAEVYPDIKQQDVALWCGGIETFVPHLDADEPFLNY